jgi:hypothetical protein
MSAPQLDRGPDPPQALRVLDNQAPCRVKRNAPSPVALTSTQRVIS